MSQFPPSSCNPAHPSFRLPFASAPDEVQRRKWKSLKKDSIDWLENWTVAHAKEDLENELASNPPKWRYQHFLREVFWAYIKLAFVSLRDAQEKQAAPYLLPLLKRFERDGFPLADHADSQHLYVFTMTIHRILIAMAEDPEVPLTTLHSCRDHLDKMFRRFNANEIAYSTLRLALMPRLGLVGQGEADYRILLDSYRKDSQKAAEIRAEDARYEDPPPGMEPPPDLDDEPSDPPVDGPTCMDGQLGFLIDWLRMENRQAEALKLLNEAYFGTSSECFPCGLGPTVSYAIGTEIALDLGQETLARHWLERSTTVTLLAPRRWLRAAGHRAAAHARLGQIAEALAVLEKAEAHASDEKVSPWSRLWFHHHAAKALTQIATHLEKTNPTAVPDLQARAQTHAAKAAALTSAFDQRNGNEGGSKRLRQALD
jgi:hypothetical protein